MKNLTLAFMMALGVNAQAAAPYTNSILCTDDTYGNTLELFAGKHINGRLTIVQNGLGSLPPGKYHLNLGPQYGKSSYEVHLGGDIGAQLLISFWRDTKFLQLPVGQIRVSSHTHFSDFRCYGKLF